MRIVGEVVTILCRRLEFQADMGLTVEEIQCVGHMGKSATELVISQNQIAHFSVILLGALITVLFIIHIVDFFLISINLSSRAKKG